MHSRTSGNAGESNKAFEHLDSLADEVRASRDPEFAVEKSATKRRKRSTERDTHRRRENENVMNVNPVSNDSTADVQDDGLVDAKTTAKILQEARKQREEVYEEERGDDGSTWGSTSVASRLAKLGGPNGSGDSKVFTTEESSDSDDDSGEEDEYEVGSELRARDIVGAEIVNGAPLTEADELALAMFTNGCPADHSVEGNDSDGGKPAHEGRLTLADVILAKIREREEKNAAELAASADPAAAAREQKIAEVYSVVGGIMAKYRSGRVPKAFKVISKLPNWEHLMYLTRPDEWTPAAMYAATRLFASNLSSKEVVVFYRDVVLPRCLQDISENKKLNYHLYRSLKKAMFKPDAFNKGILFPLCQTGGCSLREATIIGSVLSHVSMPMLHAAAAVLYIAELPYSLSHSVFLQILLNKKYALPYRVIDSLVQHFVRMNNSEPLPLVWHISLLTFARRYKTELESWQKEQLKLLMRVQTHAKVTPEVRRELFSARCRGETMDPDANTIAMAVASV